MLYTKSSTLVLYLFAVICPFALVWLVCGFFPLASLIDVALALLCPPLQVLHASHRVYTICRSYDEKYERPVL